MHLELFAIWKAEYKADVSPHGLKHEGRNSIGAITRIRIKLQISQPGKYESG